MPTEDRYSQSRNELLDQMAYAMGGRTAEEIVFHDPSTGASNDIEKATKIARRMVGEFGFTDQLGAIKWIDSDDEQGLDGLRPREYSDATAQMIDEQVMSFVETAHTEAWQIIMDNREILDELVRQLLVKQTLNEKELKEIFANIKKAPQREVWLSNRTAPIRTSRQCRSPSRLSGRRVCRSSSGHAEPQPYRNRPGRITRPGPLRYGAGSGWSQTYRCTQGVNMETNSVALRGVRVEHARVVQMPGNGRCMWTCAVRSRSVVPRLMSCSAPLWHACSRSRVNPPRASRMRWRCAWRSLPKARMCR